MAHAEAGSKDDGGRCQDVAEEGQGQGQVRCMHALLKNACIQRGNGLFFADYIQPEQHMPTL